jgi:hypothetical protein
MKNAEKPMRMVLVAVSLAVAAAACHRGREEAERKAEAERRAQEAEITAAKVQAEAADTAKLKAAHSEARTKLQKELDAHERKGTYLKQKAVGKTGAAKKNVDAAISEYTSRLAKAKTDLGRLADDASPEWDATKKAADDDVAAVGRSVEAIDHALMKK